MDLMNRIFTEEELDIVERVKKEGYATPQEQKVVDLYNLVLNDVNKNIEARNLEAQRAYDNSEKVFREPDTVIRRTKPVELGELEGDLYYYGERTDEYRDTGGNYLLTDEGIMPLDRQASDMLADDIRRTRVPSVFGSPIDANAKGWAPGELPRGAVTEIPEGDDISGYAMIGETIQLNPSGGPVTKNVYVKVLDRPTVEEEIVIPGNEVSLMGSPPIPSIPYEPVGYEMYGSEEDPAGPGYGTDYDAFVEPDAPEEEPRERRERKSINRINLATGLADIGEALSNLEFPGINIPVPDYSQPRYQSPTLGPAVQNLFRGR